MPGPPMLQGPFRVPSFNGYIPRRLQPWIYLLFAFVEFMGSTPKVLQTAFTGGVLHFGTFTTNVLNFVDGWEPSPDASSACSGARCSIRNIPDCSR